MKPHSDLLLCIREACRAAHRERDAAQAAYSEGRHTLPGNARRRKEEWYALKDRGIIAAHRAGLLRYEGATPQGMAVYEYGDGGMACFHSTLHPVGVERMPIDGHPETLMVEAKDKAKGISLERIKVTLSTLPNDTTDYERSAAPKIERRGPTCRSIRASVALSDTVLAPIDTQNRKSFGKSLSGREKREDSPRRVSRAGR